jgi:hypothetical protein
MAGVKARKGEGAGVPYRSYTKEQRKMVGRKGSQNGRESRDKVKGIAGTTAKLEADRQAKARAIWEELAAQGRAMPREANGSYWVMGI